jgi:hypothetical protein
MAASMGARPASLASLGAAGRDAEALQNGHVEVLQGPGVPALSVGGVGATTGQHGHHEGVDGAGEQLGDRRDVALGIGTQRADVDGQRIGALGLQGVAQDVDERGVAGQLVGSVEHDADGRATLVAGAGAVHAVGRQGHGSGEAVAGEQDGVGQERDELAEVVDAAFTEVAGRVRDDAGRDGGQGGQLGVEALPAQEHDRHGRCGEQRVQALPGPPPAEQPDDDQRHAVQVQRGGPAGVPHPDRHRWVGDRAGSQQVGVGRGQEEERHSSILD